jgi:hypothetical protein
MSPLSGNRQMSIFMSRSASHVRPRSVQTPFQSPSSVVVLVGFDFLAPKSHPSPASHLTCLDRSCSGDHSLIPSEIPLAVAEGDRGALFLLNSETNSLAAKLSLPQDFDSIIVRLSAFASCPTPSVPDSVGIWLCLSSRVFSPRLSPSLRALLGGLGFRVRVQA